MRQLITRTRTALAQPEPEGPGPVDYRRWYEAHSEDCNTWSEQPTAPLTLRTTVEALAWANYCLARFGRPAIEPVPEPGEVEELVRRLRDWRSIPLLEERERIATLLQQLSPPGPDFWVPHYAPLLPCDVAAPDEDLGYPEPVWTEGICGDGAAILRDGVMIPIEEVVQALNRTPAALPAPLKAKVVETPTLGDDIMRLAGEHFPYMRGDDYGRGFIPVSMSSYTLGRDLISFAHAVRALPVPSSPTPETP